MALNIKSDEADQLARHLAHLAGESITEAVTQALRERLVRLEGQRRRRGLRAEIERIQQRLAVLPRVDERSDEEILGYDDAGLPS